MVEFPNKSMNIWRRLHKRRGRYEEMRARFLESLLESDNLGSAAFSLSLSLSLSLSINGSIRTAL